MDCESLFHIVKGDLSHCSESFKGNIGDANSFGHIIGCHYARAIALYDLLQLQSVKPFSMKEKYDRLLASGWRHDGPLWGSFFLDKVSHDLHGGPMFVLDAYRKLGWDWHESTPIQ